MIASLCHVIKLKVLFFLFCSSVLTWLVHSSVRLSCSLFVCSDFGPLSAWLYVFGLEVWDSIVTSDLASEKSCSTSVSHQGRVGSVVSGWVTGLVWSRDISVVVVDFSILGIAG